MTENSPWTFRAIWTEGSPCLSEGPRLMKDFEDFEPSCPVCFCAEQLVTH